MRLWQSIFLYTLLLMLLSQVLSFVVYKYTEGAYLSVSFMAEAAAGLAEALTGENRETTASFLESFDSPHRSLWLENPDGTVYLGRVMPGMAATLRRKRLTREERGYSIDIMESRCASLPLMAQVPVTLEDGPAVICLSLLETPPSHIHMPLIHGLITVCVFGAALSFLAARRITRPLLRMRREVLEIASGNLEKRVSVPNGNREVNDVAKAVNQMAVGLADNLHSMRELLANISHELHSPLARMSISAVLMEDMLFTEHKRCAQLHQDRDCAVNCPQKALIMQEKIQTMQKEIDHIAKLIGDSLLNSKLDLCQQDIMSAPVPFSELCDEMCRRHENTLLGKGLEMHICIASNLWVLGDETLLCQVLSNLLDNSSKYTDAGGLVRVRLFARKQEVVLQVQNTHENLPGDVLKHVFDPFYRGGLPTGIGQGAGLGLSLVEKIVAAHKGGVAVDNARDSLIFTVTLPRHIGA